MFTELLRFTVRFDAEAVKAPTSPTPGATPPDATVQFEFVLKSLPVLAQTRCASIGVGAGDGFGVGSTSARIASL